LIFKHPNILQRVFFFLILAAYVWLFLNIWFEPSAKIGSGIPSVCFLKQVTGYPCPSCGTTRGVIAILHGQWFNGLVLNPFSYLVILFMLIVPPWLSFDYFNKINSLEVIFRKTEKHISKTKTAIVLIIVVMANWVWNFYKGY
jgi:hypothetical protein